MNQLVTWCLGRRCTCHSSTSWDELEYVQGLRDRLEDAYDCAREHFQSSAGRQKRYYDLMANESHYEAGDLVWTTNVP